MNGTEIACKLPIYVTNSTLCMNNGIFISDVLIQGNWCSQLVKCLDFMFATVERNATEHYIIINEMSGCSSDTIISGHIPISLAVC